MESINLTPLHGVHPRGRTNGQLDLTSVEIVPLSTGFIPVEGRLAG
jgi:hypothetical protein